MARRYAAVSCNLLDYPEWRDLPPEAQHVFWTLMHLPESGPSGIFVFHQSHLAGRCSLPEKGLRRGIDTLSMGHWVVVQPPVLWIRNALRFDPAQPLRSPKSRTGIIGHLRTLPRCALVLNFMDYYNLEDEDLRRECSARDTPSIPHRYPIEGGSLRKKEEGESERPIEGGSAGSSPVASLPPKNLVDSAESTGQAARVRKLFGLYCEIHGRNGRYVLAGKRERALRARIKEGRTDDEFEAAFRGVLRSTFHVDGGHTDLELVCRDAPHFDRFVALAEEGSAGPTPAQLAPYLKAAQREEPAWTAEEQAGLARERWEGDARREARILAGTRL